VATAGDEQRCALTDLLVRDCGHCRGIAAEPDTPASARPWTWPDAALTGPATTARFSGWCAGCDDPIEPGQQIHSDGHGGWVCAGCAGPG